MQIISGRTDFKFDKKSAVVIGKFDGIHRGHKCLLAEIEARKGEDVLTAAFTFDTSAASFFGSGDMKELTTKEEKRRRFAQLGVDILIEYPLNAETAAMSPEDFIREVLADRLNMCFVAAGTDLSFGYRGAGNSRLLQDMAAGYGYQVKIIDKIREEGREISSSYIREEVEKGNMQKAAHLLGESYAIMGEVVHGNRFGRTIGMPTVNLLPVSSKLLPPNGVYYSKVEWKARKLNGITNIGCKPTVSNEKIIGVETYLYDFEEEIYGQELTVQLLEYKRPEQRFPDVEALKLQAGKDVEEGRKYFLKEKN